LRIVPGKQRGLQRYSIGMAADPAAASARPRDIVARMVACGLRRSSWLFALTLAVAIAPARAVSLFVVNEPWVRVAPDGRSAEGFMRLKSTDGGSLVAVKSDASREVVLRGPGASRAVIAAIPLDANVTVMLAPGAYRLGLPRLERALRPGERVQFTLTIESADGTRQDISANAEVRRRSPTDDHLHPHGHAH
jgi:copper(I)-binding protein